jgi:hypothetical protein
MSRFLALALIAIPLAAQLRSPAAKTAKGYTAPKNGVGRSRSAGTMAGDGQHPDAASGESGRAIHADAKELKQRQSQAAQAAEGDSEEFVSSETR